MRLGRTRKSSLTRKFQTPAVESLEPRLLLSLSVASSLSDLSAIAAQLPASLNVSSVFTDNQTAVALTTTQGNIDLYLDNQQTPLTVANFLKYVNNGLYNGTFVHRSIPGFVIQGGGYNATTYNPVTTYAAVQNEASIPNTAGTIAMALVGSDINSATDQWFINLVDNSSTLDSQDFTVFGSVVNNGMTAVNAIAALATKDLSTINSAFTNVPEDASGNLVTVSTAAVIPMIASAGGTSWLSLSVSNNTNPSLVTASVSGGTLNLSYAPDATGTAAITLLATDLAGATIDDTFNVTVQGVTVTNQAANTHTPVLAGTITSGMTGLSATVNGQTYTQASGAITVSGTDWTLQLPTLADGTYPVTLTADDAQSNVDTASGQLIVDTTAPTVTIDSGQLPTTVEANTTLTGTYSDANISTVAVTLTGADSVVQNFPATLDTSNDTWMPRSRSPAVPRPPIPSPPRPRTWPITRPRPTVLEL